MGSIGRDDAGANRRAASCGVLERRRPAWFNRTRAPGTDRARSQQEIETIMTDNGGWYYARGQQQVGPLPLDEVVRQICALPTRERTLVYGPGMATWLEARLVPQFEAAVRGSAVDGPPPPAGPPGGAGAGADGGHYAGCGDGGRCAEGTPDPRATGIAEAGAGMS